jgi:hypothetical protein
MCLQPPSPSHTISPIACCVVDIVSQRPGTLKWQYFKEPAMTEQVVTRMIIRRHLTSAQREALTITFKVVCRQYGLISALP